MECPPGKWICRCIGIVLMVGSVLALSVAAAATAGAPGWMQSGASGFGQPDTSAPSTWWMAARSGGGCT